MKELNIKKVVSLTITKKILEKKLYLVIENNIQKEIKSNVKLNKNFTITKKDLKFTSFFNNLNIKKIKLPLFCKSFGSSKELSIYLVSINKKKHILPVFIKIKSLTFRNSNTLTKYSVSPKEIVNRFSLLNRNYIKLILVLKKFILN